jgi:hypothetical protein
LFKNSSTGPERGEPRGQSVDEKEETTRSGPVSEGGDLEFSSIKNHLVTIWILNMKPVGNDVTRGHEN